MLVSLIEGRVKSYRLLPKGQSVTNFIFGPGDVFGFMPLFDDAPYPAFAQALGAVKARIVTRARLHEAIRRDPDLALQLLKQLSRCLRVNSFQILLPDEFRQRERRPGRPKGRSHVGQQGDGLLKNYREKSVPASKVPDETVEPLVQKVMGAADDQLLNIGEVFDYEVVHKPHSFSGFVCDRCEEMTVDGYGRPLGDQKVCIPCYEQALAEVGPLADEIEQLLPERYAIRHVTLQFEDGRRLTGP